MNKKSILLFFIILLLTPIADSQENHLKFTYEEWSLSEEKLGVTGLRFQHDLSPNYLMGIETWMAVKGKRGGFITLGVDGTYKVYISPSLTLYNGIFIGAGGGNGGYYLSGGGLMIRPHVSFSYSLSRLVDISAGYSHVFFPNGGSIDSSQPFIQLSTPLRNKSSSSINSDTSLNPIFRYMIPSDNSRTTGNKKQNDFSLIGIEAKSYINDKFYLKLETEGSAGGDSSGYMQILVGTGLEIPLSQRLILHSDISIGGGGGGAVETGGGLLLDAGLGFIYYLSPQIFLGVTEGYMQAPDGELEVQSRALKIGYTSAGNINKIKHHFDQKRIRFVYQKYLQADTAWRVHHNHLDVGCLGIQLDSFINEDWYLTGQGIAAESGQAGAYMTGLLGLGREIKWQDKWFVSSEFLLGAAGGGGLATGSGCVWQINYGLGYRVNKKTEILFSGGRIESFDGPFAANVLGLSLNYDLNLFD